MTELNDQNVILHHGLQLGQPIIPEPSDPVKQGNTETVVYFLLKRKNLENACTLALCTAFLSSDVHALDWLRNLACKKLEENEHTEEQHEEVIENILFLENGG